MELTIAAWLGRITVGILIIVVGGLYGHGWSRLQAADKPVKRWQTATFVIGLSLTGFTLVSEFATLAAQYHSVREIQHILITGLVPLLLLISDPFVTLLAGLPDTVRQRIRKWGTPGHRVHTWVQRLTAPGLIWCAFVSTFWLWHDQTLVALSRQYAWVHLLEIISLVGVASVYWWQIAEARPRLHRPMTGLMRLGYVFAGMFPIKLLGFFFLFGSETSAGGVIMSASADQMIEIGNLLISDRSLSAIILWFMGGFTYTYSAIFLAGQQMGVEEEKPTRPISVLEEDETWRAPAIRR